MKIDTGLTIVIVAVLIFYLRLIIIQRERAKRIKQMTASEGKKRKGSQAQPAAPSFSILSHRRSDWIIAGLGVLGIIVGIMLYAGWLLIPAVQPYWWIPISLGIVAFSWAFRS
jgi:hypothetical protein